MSRRLVRAGLLTGVIDGLWAVVLTHLYGGEQIKLWQRIAATAFGDSMYNGGVKTAALGLLMHFTVAFTWSAILLLLITRSRWLQQVLDSPLGVLKIAMVYGPLIWLVMSLIVVPILTHKPFTVDGVTATFTYRWFIQAAGHIAFVGAPMAWALRKGTT
ncbi:MAG: hypothetical protein V4550_02285 [Gemmatimonadota bacterium]